jgi:hypothetical protein
MFVRNSAHRWLVVTVAAYAMVLHALVMGVVSAPRATAGEGGLIGTLQELCSGGTMSMTGDGEPQSAPRTMACSLCSVGHAAVDIPHVMHVALPVNIIETVTLTGAAESAQPRLDFLYSIRPRAPPAVG